MNETQSLTDVLRDYVKLAIGATLLITLYLGPPAYIAYVLITRWGDPLTASHTVTKTVTETVHTGILSDISWVLPLWIMVLLFTWSVIYAPLRV